MRANWPAGILVVQDHENTNPAEPQNFKYVAWDAIERELDIGSSQNWPLLPW
jgi:myo-inositol-hexaphosphate 3-phosphohydrolase